MTDAPSVDRARTPGNRWARLLDEAAAGRAIDVAQQIAHALTDPGGRADLAAYGPTLGSGLPGIALFFTALGEVTGDQSHFDTAMSMLNLAIDQTGSSRALSNRFYGTPIGLGWALHALEGRLFDSGSDCADIDELVSGLAGISPWRGSFDLINGLVGLGIYSLERLPHPDALRDVALLVERLDEIAEVSGPGTSWFTGPNLVVLFPEQAKSFPTGYYDLGFAHGVAGVIAFLAEATRVGVERAREPLAGAVRWFRGHRLADPDRGTYPGLVGPGHTPIGCRMAWCYGDPGFAVALLAAGYALGDDEIVAEAAQVARRCIGRVTTAAIHDAGFCHGSSGAAHLFNRLGQALGDEELLDLARYWLAYTIEHRDGAMPIAGFPALRHVGPGNAAVPVPAADVLEGVAGVGLVLLAAASGTEPWWDRMFLVTSPAAWTGA